MLGHQVLGSCVLFEKLKMHLLLRDLKELADLSASLQRRCEYPTGPQILKLLGRSESADRLF